MAPLQKWARSLAAHRRRRNKTDLRRFATGNAPLSGFWLSTNFVDNSVEAGQVARVLALPYRAIVKLVKN